MKASAELNLHEEDEVRIELSEAENAEIAERSNKKKDRPSPNALVR